MTLDIDREVRDRPDEITEEMIEAGEGAIMGRIGGADLGGAFSARDLAILVFSAMAGRQKSGLVR